MKITIFLIFAGGIFFSCVHSGRVKRTSDTWPTEEQIREYVSSHTSENANNETQISDYDPNLSEGNAKYDEDDKDDPVDTHGYGEQKLSEKSKLKDDRQTQGSYYGNYNDYPFDMENYEEQFRKQHRHKKHGSPRDEVYHSSNLHSVELTRQAHTVILIDGLTEYEKEHLPVSVTYETNVTPKEWIKYHDFLFRKRASEILNDCHDLWVCTTTFNVPVLHNECMNELINLPSACGGINLDCMISNTIFPTANSPVFKTCHFY
ncbi:hypothetical protein C0J52_05662 [Blattella germanica]|nr:hypothetical protein C0J52_05662 [Blattella germanica]